MGLGVGMNYLARESSWSIVRRGQLVRRNITLMSRTAGTFLKVRPGAKHPLGGFKNDARSETSCYPTIMSI